jgi:hypothetical protein
MIIDITVSKTPAPDWPIIPSMAEVRFPPPSGWVNMTIGNLAMKYAPNLSHETDKLAIAFLLRDQIYHRCKMEPTPLWMTQNDWLNFNTVYSACIKDRSYGHECQGRGYLYLMALKALGIQGRYVGLWPTINITDPAHTLVHASCEVFINGRWIVCDPHYNITLKDDTGRLLSWQEAQVKLHANLNVTQDYNGFSSIPTLNIAHYLALYNTTLKDMTRYMMIGITPGVSATPVSTEGAWNGTMTILGSSFDAKAMAEGPIYQALV